MNELTEHQVQALRDLRHLWPETPFSLVGAAGLACQMVTFQRQTNDLDVSVALSVNELPSALGRLPGWQRHPRLEHEWLSPAGAKVDVIPAGPELLAAGRVVWPGGHTMSLLGLRHTFERTTVLEVAPDLRVNVATVATIALLKMVAYQERPHDRSRDLGDLALILEHYVPDDDERRYSEAVLSAGIMYEQVSAFLLGRDLAAMANGEEAHAVETFIQRARGRIDGGRTEAVMLQQAPIYWRSNPEALTEKIGALAQGLRSR